ncbi:MAG: fatty acid desaturase [Bdellovibrionia bacterium]
MPQLEFRKVDYPEPHVQRAREILRAHPEVRELFGPTPSTAFFVFGLVGLQIAGAWLLRDSPWWAILIAAYSIGALACHGLWALIHDCTHNLAFRGNRANSWLQIIANLPHLLPSAMSFRKYHLLHHKYQGDLDLDADLAAPFEVRFAGTSAPRKALWLLFYFVFQSVRIGFLKKIPLVDRWIFLNFLVGIPFVGLMFYFTGPGGLAYLFLSSIFSIGLHPVGARWIQEHFMVHPVQETYSYYGVLNFTAFNVGYHNEHHDFVSVPWSRLPKLKAAAPEFYDGLVHHKSWTKLLLRFIFDPNLHLRSRTIREATSAEALRFRFGNSPARPAPSERTSPSPS